MHKFSQRPGASTKRSPAAKKSLGQNFLQDANIARKIVEALHIEPNDLVIEIGPGPGALTKHLLASQAKHLLLVEKDTYWAQYHCEKGGRPLASLEPSEWPCTLYGDGDDEARLLVGEIDALTVPWEAFNEPVKIIGNLPYNVASPLMWDILSKSRGCERAVFMIQKEVGMRLAAKPGSREYGALSVWIQSFCTPKIEFIVPPQVFHPRPKVHSAVVSFAPLPLNPALDYKALSSLVKLCFQARRKQLGNVLKHLQGIDEAFTRAGIRPTLRPEELGPTDFHRLVMLLFPKKH